MGENRVTVTALDKRYKKLERGLQRTALTILEFLKQKGAEVEVYLVGAPQMRVLNRQYRGGDGATNVLAFTSPIGFPASKASRYLGEIYLAPSYIKKKGEDINFLLVHGLLHLIGFNHARVSDKMTMVKIEKKLMAWLNH